MQALQIAYYIGPTNEFICAALSAYTLFLGAKLLHAHCTYTLKNCKCAVLQTFCPSFICLFVRAVVIQILIKCWSVCLFPCELLRFYGRVFLVLA